MFREFKVGELLDVTQGRRLKKSDFQDGDIPFVMASSKNNGVVAYLSNPVTTNTNFITADILGNVFYHDDLVGFGDDNCGLKLKEGHESEAVYLYLVGAFSRFKSIASYGNKLRGKWYEEQFIQLPVKPGTDEVNYTGDDIDWCYMESYIQELEESYIQELEESYIQELDAYLKETGLDDYTLTDDEREVLEREPVFKGFEVGELFDVVGRGTRLTKQNRIAGNVPLVTAGRENQGVAEYIQENKQLFRGPVFTIDMFGNVFVRDYDFYADDNIIVFGKEGLSINQFLYIASALDYLSGVYGYGNQFRLNSIGKTFISLPVKPGTDVVNYTEDDIDWDYMDVYARVMEKQVIADVVDYKNEVIATTKGLIKN